LLLTLHHIVSDGWSMGVLVRELAALYEAFSAGRSSPLTELPVQYADYSVWQRAWLQGEALEAQRSWWRHQLAGAPSLLELPTDRLRPATRTYRGAMRTVSLSRGLSESLRALGRREGVTPFMLLLAAFQVLLSRYSGQEDISVGSPIAGRRMAELEGLIGFFVNTLVLRSRLPGEFSFLEVLARVKETTLGAFAHQDIPFEKLVEELAPERSLGHSPLFQVMFALQNIPTGEFQLPGITLRQEQQESTTTKFDFSLALAEGPEGFGGSLTYSTDLFDATTVARMMRHFQVLLEAITTRPDTALRDLPLLTGEECHQVLKAWNQTAEAVPSGCIHSLFEAQTKRRPSTVAVVADGRQLTYAELDARANGVARQLHARGVGPEVLVGLYVERTVESVVGMLGILKAGGGYVPMDTSFPTERVKAIVGDARLRLVVTQKAFAEDLAGLGCQTLFVEDASADTTRVESGVQGGNAAYAIFTSGSTGRPKGVVVEHRQLANYVETIRGRLKLVEGMSFASVTTLAADLGHTAVFPMLCGGGTLHLIAKDVASDAEALGAYMQAHRVEGLKVVPSHLRALLSGTNAKQVLPLKRLVVGGEASDRALVETVQRLAPECAVFNHYGPTETTVGVLTNGLEGVWEEGTTTLALGRPIGNARMYVLDASGRPVPRGVAGELYVGGAAVTRGYVGRPELTAERYVPDAFSEEAGARLYRTGDRVRQREDGKLEFLGRFDSQVKLRGFRIEPGEIEAVLKQAPGIRQAAVLVREDVPAHPHLVAYLVPTADALPSQEALRAFLKTKLPEYMLPTAFLALERLPLTLNGKLDRRALPAPEASRGELEQAFILPRDALELEVARAFEEVLEVHPIGVRSHFFELGGHSLLAVRLLAVLARRTQKRVPLGVLFQAPTVERLATALRTEAGPGSPLLPLQREGSRRPFFCVHPVGGNVLAYAELARRLGPDQPFYGLQSQGLDGIQPPLESVEEMAACYIEALRTVQPDGPYRLGGWSMGGVVAFEMARQLERRGERVELLALIDPSPARTGPDASDDATPDTVERFAGDLGRITGLQLPTPPEGTRPEELLQAVLEEGRKHGVLIPEAGLPEMRTLFQVFSANTRALRRYVPGRIDGPLTVLRAVDAIDFAPVRRDRGWGGTCGGGVELHEVPGDHYSLLQPPRVQALAERLKALLLRAAPELTDAREASGSVPPGR
ncbi:MAG: non-ribosomal peptide synthetase, partial [Myxococcaceae bacterium]